MVKINQIKPVVTAAIAVILLSTAIHFKVAAQHQVAATVTNQAEIEKLKAAVLANPDSLSVHMAYTKAVGIEGLELEKQYAIWLEQFPQSAMVPYAIGKAYLDKENAKARPYLLKAITIDPDFTPALIGLWQDGQRWGDYAAAQNYLARATEAAPDNPDYAFYYASSFKGIDNDKYEQLSLKLTLRFPEHERAAQAVYWLAMRAKTSLEKLKYFTLLQYNFPPEKFFWSESGMVSYYMLLLSGNPAEAVKLALEMEKKEKAKQKQWPGLLVLAQNITKARSLLAKHKAAESLELLNQVKLPKYIAFKKDLALLKAQANDMAGNTLIAYDSLIVAFANAPAVALKNALVNYSIKLGKTTADVDADIWKRLDAEAKMATPFTLKRYLTPGEASLTDYKGKVILLTYWFPGCGPCRAEFPHFDNVVEKFKGQPLEYLGINTDVKQNEYVLSFMKASGHSFTPLEDVADRQKGTLDNYGRAPVNFLIDKQGRVIFSNFLIGEDNEEELELMIGMLLQRA